MTHSFLIDFHAFFSNHNNNNNNNNNLDCRVVLLSEKRLQHFTDIFNGNIFVKDCIYLQESIMVPAGGP